jgi:hypothetical protein
MSDVEEDYTRPETSESTILMALVASFSLDEKIPRSSFVVNASN